MRYPTQAGTLVLVFAGCLAAAAQEADGLDLQDKPKVAFSMQFKDEAIGKAARETLAGSKAAQTAPALETQPAAPEADGARKASALPDRATIRAAVRSVLDEQPAIPRLHEADTLRANQYDRFARQVEEATVPDCLHADGLKRQPTFFLTGLLALPFIAVAKVRGKCQ